MIPVARPSMGTEHHHLFGAFPSHFRLSPSCCSSPSCGSCLNRLVGWSKWVVKKRLDTFSVAFVEKKVTTLARQKQNSKTFITLSNSNVKRQSRTAIGICFGALVLVNFTLAAEYNWSSGSKSCKNGSELLVLLSTVPPSFSSLGSLTRTVCGSVV